MPRFCSVIGCGSNNAKDKNISFHKFPSMYDNNRRINPLAKERREKWVDALQRPDFTETKIKYGYVCSKHFVEGKPSKLYDKNNVDWIPTQLLGHSNSILKTKEEIKHYNDAGICKKLEGNKSESKGNEKLVNCCRACLKKREGMKYLLDNTEEANVLLAKFFTVLNLEIQIDSKYPFYLCKICETKINSSYEFREQCIKSNEVIYQFLANPENESKNDVTNNIKSPKVNLLTDITEDRSDSRYSSNDQQCQEDVVTAIEALNKKYMQVDCVFCNFQVNTSNELLLHVTRTHQDIIGHWCSECNSLYIDAIAHSEIHNKDFLCLFCNFQLFTSKSTIEHLLMHKDDFETSKLFEPNKNTQRNSYDCCHCKRPFTNKKSLEVHLHSCVEDTREDNLLRMDAQENISVEGDKEMEAKDCQDEMETLGYGEHSKINGTNQRMRLDQYDSEDVDRVIKSVREKLYRHVTCIFCQFEAICTRTLSVHVTRLHSEYKGQWCSTCNELTDNLELHNHNVHCEDLKCPFCGKIPSNMGHFVEHMTSHSVTRLYKCTICHKSYISLRHLKTHQATHINHKACRCKFCKKKFRRPKFLREHIRIAHKRAHFRKDALKTEENSPCFEEDTDDIKNTFESSCSDTYQDDLEKMEPQNYCKQCDKKVRSLQHHNNRYHSSVPTVNEDKKNLCPHCGKQFKTKSKLTLHIRIHTGEAPYKCQYCDKRLKTRNILVTHERTHTGEKPYTCTICGKSFAQSSVLNTHLRIHTGRPEQCTICDKKFCRPAELKVHMRKHTGEKPYTCDVCNQSFTQRSHLVEHSRRHSDDRPFKCKFCEKSFKNISTLKYHLQIHSGDKPFKCSQCSYACRQPYSLTQHMQQHELDRPQASYPHTCEICQRKFITIAHLTAHYNRFHSQISLTKTSGKPDEEPQNDRAITSAQFVPESIEFMGTSQSIRVDDSSQIQMVERTEHVETNSIQNEGLNETNYDQMFEFTVIQ